MNRLTRSLAMAAGAMLLAAASTVTHAQQVTKMKIQTAVPTASIYFDLMKRFGDRVDKMSNGRIKMEILQTGP